MQIRRRNLQALRLFTTTDFPCSYLPGRNARNLVADPATTDNALYSQLIRLGFRRSGDYIYRPYCAGCNACQSLRVPVNCFQPNRSQRRTWEKNSDLTVYCVAPDFSWDHYQLFARYLRTRHAGGGMDDNITPDGYLEFLAAFWSHTMLYEFRLHQQLLAVAAVDRLEDGLSAVYTFFEPDARPRSLGTYAILWEIAEAQRLDLQWLYLGYWIADCDKMRYKALFRPYQLFTQGKWRDGNK